MTIDIKGYIGILMDMKMNIGIFREDEEHCEFEGYDFADLDRLKDDLRELEGYAYDFQKTLEDFAEDVYYLARKREREEEYKSDHEEHSTMWNSI
jgi:hypothetical protein